MKRRIICYDAGFVNLGYMVAELPKQVGSKPMPIDFGVSHAPLPPKKKRNRKKGVTEWSVERIIKQVDAVRRLHMKYSPVGYFIELPHSGAKSALAAKGMAYATSYLITALHLLCTRNVHIRFFLPKSVKKCVTGDISASKLDVARAVLAYWPEIEHWPDFKVITKKKTVKGSTIIIEDKAASHDATDAGAVCIAATRSPDYAELWETNDRESEIDF
jgi:hypothetical protein